MSDRIPHPINALILNRSYVPRDDAELVTRAGWTVEDEQIDAIARHTYATPAPITRKGERHRDAEIAF